MRAPHLPRRTPVSLTVSSPGEVEPPSRPARIPYLPWVVAAVVWSAGAVVLGFALVLAGAVAGWLTALRTPPAAVVHTAGQGWLAAHGVAADVGPLTVRLVPWGLSVVFVAAAAVVAHHAAGQVQPDSSGAGRAPWRSFGAVVGTCVATTTAASGLLASLVASPDQALAVLPGAAGLAAVGSGYGALRGLDLDPLAGRPLWVRRLPAAAGVGLGVLAAGSAAALVVALVAHAERIGALHAALGPDAVGAALLVGVQLAFWPNLVAWAGAWALGAGVDLGQGSLVTPGATTVGSLPGIPVFGAVPVAGSDAMWAWLLLGAAAGAAAGWWLVRGLPAGSVDDLEPWPWQAALAGVAAGGAWAAFSWLTRGDLGTDRLVGLGPHFPDLVWLAIAPLGLTAGAAGLVCHGLALRRVAPAGADEVGAVPVPEPVAVPAPVAVGSGPGASGAGAAPAASAPEASGPGALPTDTTDGSGAGAGR